MRTSTSARAERGQRLAARAPATSTPPATSCTAPIQTSIRSGSSSTPRVARARQHRGPSSGRRRAARSARAVLGDRAHGRARLAVVGGAGHLVAGEARGALAVGDHLAGDVEQRRRRAPRPSAAASAPRRRRRRSRRSRARRACRSSTPLPSTETRLNEASAAPRSSSREQRRARRPRRWSPTTIVVAMSGRIIPAPLAIAPRRTSPPLSAHVAVLVFGPGVGRADRIRGGLAAVRRERGRGRRDAAARWRPSAAACRSRRSSRRAPRRASMPSALAVAAGHRARVRHRPARRCRRWRCRS